MKQISKTQIIDMPTKVSDFTNDAGYVTKNVNDLANYYKKAEVDANTLSPITQADFDAIFNDW